MNIEYCFASFIDMANSLHGLITGKLKHILRTKMCDQLLFEFAVHNF